MNLQQQVNNVAAQGRYGDSMLMHVNPAEVRGLSQVAPITINPQTGQPEAFLPALLPLLAPMLGSMALPAAAATAFGAGTALTGIGGAALGSGLAQWAATGSMKQGLLAGLTGYGIGSALQGAKTALAVTAAEKAGTAAGLAGTEIAKTAAKQAGSEAAIQASTSKLGSTIGNLKDVFTGTPDLSAAVTDQLVNATVNPAVTSVVPGPGIPSGYSLPVAPTPTPTLNFGDRLGALGSGISQPSALAGIVGGMGPTSIIQSEEEFRKRVEAQQRGEEESKYQNWLMNPEPTLYSAGGGSTNMDESLMMDADLLTGSLMSNNRTGYATGGTFPADYQNYMGTSTQQRFTPARQAYDINPDFMAGFAPETMYFQPNTVNAPASATAAGQEPTIEDTYRGTRGGYDAPGLSAPPREVIDPYAAYTGSAPQGLIQSPAQPYSEPVLPFGGEVASNSIESQAQPLVTEPSSFSVSRPPGINDYSGFGGYRGFDNIANIANLSPATPTSPAVTPSAPTARVAADISDEFYPDGDEWDARLRNILGEYKPTTSDKFYDPRMRIKNEPTEFNNLTETPPPPLGVSDRPATFQPQPLVPQQQPAFGPDFVRNNKIRSDKLRKLVQQNPEIMQSTQPTVDDNPFRGQGGLTPSEYMENIGGLETESGRFLTPAPMYRPPTPVPSPVPLPPPMLPESPANIYANQNEYGGFGGFGGYSGFNPLSNNAPGQDSGGFLTPVPSEEMPYNPYFVNQYGRDFNFSGGGSISQPNRLELFSMAPQDYSAIRNSPKMADGGGTSEVKKYQQGDITRIDAIEEMATPVQEMAAPAANIEADIMQDSLTQEVVMFITGESDNQQAVNDFVTKYGPEVFSQLRDYVLKSLTNPDVQTEGLIAGNNNGGMADDIPGKIGANEKIAVSQDEFIVPADVVSLLGGGSTDSGSKELYNMMDRVRLAKTGKITQPPRINAKEFLPG